MLYLPSKLTKSLTQLTSPLDSQCDAMNADLSEKVSQWKMDENKRNLNCIFAKKRNSHGHFKYIKNIKSYLGIVVLVLSLCFHPQKILYFHDF